MKNKELQGSYTVEASLIMPIILIIIITLMYMAFYLHDISKINGVIDKTLIKSSFIIRHEATFLTGETNYEIINKRGVLFHLSNLENETETLSSYVKNSLSTGLIISKIQDIDVNADHNEVYIKVKVKMKIPFAQAKKYITGSGKEICIKKKAIVHNPTEFIRLFDGLARTATKIDGLDEVLGKQKENE